MRRAAYAGIVLALTMLVGCVRVQAHQRQHLAKRAMNPGREPIEQKLDNHVTEYREGSFDADRVPLA